MPVTVTVEVNDALPLAVLEAIAQASQPPLHPKMREAVHRAQDAWDADGFRFFNRNAKGGGLWPALAPSTVARKKRRGTLAKGILRDTDKLYTSLRKGSPGNVNRDLPDGVQRGTNVPYAIFHQMGTSKMPARPIKVDPDANMKQRIMGNITGGIRDVIAGMVNKG
jgi:phage gpG-like protein